MHWEPAGPELRVDSATGCLAGPHAVHRRCLKEHRHADEGRQAVAPAVPAGEGGAEVGVVFCTVVIVTGPIWARPVWGIWWAPGDIRLTTTLVLWLIYISYLVLRRFSTSSQTPVIAAVVAIFGALDVPLVYFSIWFFRTQHPSPVIGGGGSLDPRILWLTAAVMFWTAGFDIIYSCQDYEFDTGADLFSLPRRLGVAGALLVSRFLHAAMLACLLALVYTLQLGALSLVGIAVVASLLIYEHRLVKPDDLSRVNAALFTINGYVSVLFFLFWAADIFYASRF